MGWRWNEFRSFHMKSLSLILKARIGNCHSKDSAVTRGSRFSEQLSSLLSLFLKAEKSHEPVPGLLIYTKAPGTRQFGCNCLRAATAGAQSSSLVPARDGLCRPGGLRPAGSTMLEAWSLCWRAACTKPSLFKPWMLAYTAGTVHVQVAVMESHMMPVWRGLWRSPHHASWWKQGDFKVWSLCSWHRTNKFWKSWGKEYSCLGRNVTDPMKRIV